MSIQPLIIYQSENGDVSFDVVIQDETVRFTIDQMTLLFGKSRSTINEHILNIINEGELTETVILKKVGNSDFSTKPTNHYNLDMILAVGYRVKSRQGMQFRNRASQRLKEYMIQGFSLNESKLKSGKPTEYFDKLQNKLREIRLSERLFYQKIKDIYTTSIDYDPKDDKTIDFFKIVQNKLLWAISQQTAAELVYNRANSELPLLGMLSYDKKSDKNITKQDINIAKNYLNEDEIKTLGLIVEQYLAFAETMAQANIAMTMNDWIQRLDSILQLNQKNILNHAGKISHELASEKANIEYIKYKDTKKLLEKESSIRELERDIKSINSHTSNG